MEKHTSAILPAIPSSSKLLYFCRAEIYQLLYKSFSVREFTVSQLYQVAQKKYRSIEMLMISTVYMLKKKIKLKRKMWTFILETKLDQWLLRKSDVYFQKLLVTALYSK